MKKPYVALAPFLADCPPVTTLGVRPALMDYSLEELELLRSAEVVFFPTRLYARIFHSAGIPTFPSFTCHIYRSSNLHQIILLKMMGFPHPATRIYYGKNRNSQVLRDFSFPFTVLPPFGKTSRPPFEVKSVQEFEACFRKWNPLIVQRSGPWDKKLTLLCTSFQILGGSLQSDDTSPPTPLDTRLLNDACFNHPVTLTHRLVKAAALDDICLEWARQGGTWRLLSIRRPTVEMAAPNRFAYLCGQIVQGNIGRTLKGPCEKISPLMPEKTVGQPL